MAKEDQPLLLAGPTAVGKSAVALALAEKLDAEIISVDSMQVYRGLDIGTSKPSAEERRRAPHHLIDVVNLEESFDAAQFLRLARAAVAEIRSRRHLPLLCGGTGLYFKAFLQGVGDSPPADPSLRRTLEVTPTEELLKELAERDPATYAAIDRQNPRRVIRAIEVLRLTGRPFSEQRSHWSPKSPAQRDQSPKPAGPEPMFLVLRRSMADLRQRIDARVEAMFRNGLVAETRQLLQRGLIQNHTAMQALGYRQVVEHLDGKRSLSETIELVETKTRQFAKRQMTWFRNQADVHWLDVAENESVEQVANRVLAHFQSRITSPPP